MREKPMPLGDLPGYIKSARGHGQEDIPVVDVGRIVDSGSFWDWGVPFVYAVVICLLMGGVGVLAVSGSNEFTIVSGADAKTVTEIVSAKGGSVFSVSEEGDGVYKVRVFTFERASQFLERLRGNKEFKRVDLE